MNVDDYVLINKRILKLVGLYPINLPRYYACLFSMSLIVVPQICQIYLSRRNFNVLMETSSVLLTLLLAISKSLVWLANSSTTRLVEFMLGDYWSVSSTLDPKNYMKRFAKLGRNVTRGYLFLIVNSLLFFYTLQPLRIVIMKFQEDSQDVLQDDTDFPFPATYPKFCYQSPFYEVTYASQLLATGSCGLVILAMDTLIATALFHTSGHFKILRENLLNLNDYFDQIENSEDTKIINRTKYTREITSLRKRVKSLLDHHELIIRFSDDLERAFNPIMFLQVMASSLIICLVGFQVTSTVSKSEKLVQYLSYLVMALFQILLFCWPGDEMIFQSAMISEAAFSTNWYKSSRSVKIEVYMLILRSQKPSCLTAGKFYTMSLQQFSTILSTSMSYLTLLQSVNSG